MADLAAQPEQKAPLPDLTALTKYIGGVAAFAYGTGIVALNTYLHGLGIADFSFAKPKLLLTGTLILASFLLLASAPVFAAWQMAGGLAASKNNPESAALSRGLFMLGIASLALLAATAYFLCFRVRSELGEIREWWLSGFIGMEQNGSKLLGCVLVVVLLYAPVWIAAIAAFQARKHLGRAALNKPGAHIYLERFYGALAIALLLVSVIAYIAMFTFLIYPAVPVEFGGGKPYFESFAINDGQQCQLRQIGIPFADDIRGVTRPLPVLHESDTVVAIWVRRMPEKEDAAQVNEGKGWGSYDDVVVQIDKSTIIAIRSFPHARAIPELTRTQGPCNSTAEPASSAK
jgi:hypothetical protein